MIGFTIWHAAGGTLSQVDVIGVVAITALVANAAVAVLLYRFWTGDANMRSVWICSRNDAIGNIALLAAAAHAFCTGAGWPDIVVAAIMAALSISGGRQIVRQARCELAVTGSLANRLS